MEHPSNTDILPDRIPGFEIVTQHIAAMIVRVCLEKGHWKAFSYSELKAKCNEADVLVRHRLDQLYHLNMINVLPDDCFEVTPEFIEICRPHVPRVQQICDTCRREELF
jgi:hypothetical protein